ncbi:MAG: PAS domain-containing protein [Gaiellaceae bacterium]
MTLRIIDDDDAFRRRGVMGKLRRQRPDADVVAAATAQAHPSLDPADDRFRVLANSSSLLIWMSDPDSRVVFVNQRWLDFTGRTLEQELGDGWIGGVHPDDRVRVERYMRAHERRGEPYTQQYRVIAADGEYRTVVDARPSPSPCRVPAESTPTPATAPTSRPTRSRRARGAGTRCSSRRTATFCAA